MRAEIAFLVAAAVILAALPPAFCQDELFGDYPSPDIINDTTMTQTAFCGDGICEGVERGICDSDCPEEERDGLYPPQKPGGFEKAIVLWAGFAACAVVVIIILWVRGHRKKEPPQHYSEPPPAPPYETDMPYPQSALRAFAAPSA